MAGDLFENPVFVTYDLRDLAAFNWFLPLLYVFATEEISSTFCLSPLLTIPLPLPGKHV